MEDVRGYITDNDLCAFVDREHGRSKVDNVDDISTYPSYVSIVLQLAGYSSPERSREDLDAVIRTDESVRIP